MEKTANKAQFMSGNEAIARGAVEAGVGFCSSYPGTPATEIAASIMGLAEKHDIYCEWSVNEKVALEAAAGASWLGIPAMCSMKSLGINVASDFLLNVNLSGTGTGGLVVVVSDDPRGHSSSNEQDSRFYAKAAQLPLLEPSTCQQSKDITTYALDLSRREQIPVLVRSTTRLSHSRSLVKLGEIPEDRHVASQKLPARLFNVPDPHLRHRDLLLKMERISREFDVSTWNELDSVENSDLLLVSSGVSQRYTQDAIYELSKARLSHLRLATTHPLPKRLVARAIEGASRVLFVEEADPFIEDEIRAFVSELPKAPKMYGKKTGEVPGWGEMNSDTVVDSISRTLGLIKPHRGEEVEKAARDAEALLVERPLTFCAGCTHRNVYWAIRALKKRKKQAILVLGDIGCYSLGVFYDNTMETMQAMGSGIGAACGAGQLQRFGLKSKVIAVAGDSTFFHACIPALVNARHKKADLTFIVLDNETTAMTGFQSHPGAEPVDESERRVGIENIVRSLDPEFIVVKDSDHIPTIMATLEDALSRSGLKVLILRGVCRLYEGRSSTVPEGQRGVTVNPDACRGEKCRICTGQYGCVALSWDREAGRPVIMDAFCVKCGSCVDVCPHGALRRED